MENTITRRPLNILAGFIVAWVFLNIIQSCVTGIYPDEAYYWIYSQHLQWGYFDHPPLVALVVKLGELFGHGSFYTRLGTVLVSGGSVYFLYKAIPPAFANIKFFITSFVSVVLFHIYGFVATPDAALFFFTALFFCAYRRYLNSDNFKNCFFLSVSIVGMLYSKYHGVLPLFFVFLSNPKLIFKTSAWAIVATVIIALLPHIYWQYTHDWRTLNYHLYDRVGSPYKISKTINYLVGQLLVWGPVTTIPAFFLITKLRTKDRYLKAHYFTFFGVLIFFFLFSFRSGIEPHWTLIAGVPFVVLLQPALQKASERFRKIFFRLAIVNIFLILAIRILLFIPGSPITRSNNLKPLFYGKEWSDSVYKHAGAIPVVFIDSYVLPSLYKYYHPNVQTTGFNTISYRRNHFTISDDEIRLNNKTAYVEVGKKIDSSDLFMEGLYTNIYLHLVDSFKAVNALKIKWDNVIKRGKPSEEARAFLTLRNSSKEIIADSTLAISYTFYRSRKDKVTSSPIPINRKRFVPGEEIKKEILLKLPSRPGKYRLVFSVKYFPFEGTLASDYYNVIVD
jgi:hypothetical protein